MAAECTKRSSSVMVLVCWLDNRICKLAWYCCWLFGIQPRGTLNGFQNLLKQRVRKHKLQCAARWSDPKSSTSTAPAVSQHKSELKRMKSICRLMPAERRNVQFSGSCSRLAKQRPNIWNSRIISPRSLTFHCLLKSPVWVKTILYNYMKHDTHTCKRQLRKNRRRPGIGFLSSPIPNLYTFWLRGWVDNTLYTLLDNTTIKRKDTKSVHFSRAYEVNSWVGLL